MCRAQNDIKDNAECPKHGVQLIGRLDDGSVGGTESILLGKGRGDHLALHEVIALGLSASGGSKGTGWKHHEEWL